MLDIIAYFIAEIIFGFILYLIGEIPIGPKPNPNRKKNKKRRRK